MGLKLSSTRLAVFFLNYFLSKIKKKSNRGPGFFEKAGSGGFFLSKFKLFWGEKIVTKRIVSKSNR